MKALATIFMGILSVGTAFSAEPYPVRPIRMIVGFAPGGGTDLTARPVAQKLSELLGQQVIVENRPGAAGNIATEQVVKAPPDGYTLLMGTIAALAINPSLYGDLRFDPETDLAPVIQVVDATNVLALHPSVPAGSVKELIALAREKSLSAGSSGIGATGHLSIELFNLMAGVKLVHVPYKGGGPAMADLVGGQVNLIFATTASAIPHLKSGRIKGIAVTTAKRSALLPDLPTISESGLPGYEVTNWYGVMMPAGVTKDVLSKIHGDLVKILKMPDVHQRFQAEGGDTTSNTPEQFAAFIKTEIAKWGKAVRESGAKVD